MSLARIADGNTRQVIKVVLRGNLTNNIRTTATNGVTFSVTGSGILQNASVGTTQSWTSGSPLSLRNTSSGYISTAASNLLVWQTNYEVQSGSFRFYASVIRTSSSNNLLLTGTGSTGISFFVFTDRYLYIQANGVVSFRVANITIVAGQWYSVFWRYQSGTSGTVQVWLNGVLRLTSANTFSPGAVAASDPIALLGNPVNTSLFFNGWMTDIVLGYSQYGYTPPADPLLYVNAAWK
jgi:hypothetical protein